MKCFLYIFNQLFADIGGKLAAGSFSIQIETVLPCRKNHGKIVFGRNICRIGIKRPIQISAIIPVEKNERLCRAVIVAVSLRHLCRDIVGDKYLDIDRPEKVLRVKIHRKQCHVSDSSRLLLSNSICSVHNHCVSYTADMPRHCRNIVIDFKCVRVLQNCLRTLLHGCYVPSWQHKPPMAGA